MFQPPLPVRRERAGVRGEGAAELERRTTQFSKQALTLTLSLRTAYRERGQEGFTAPRANRSDDAPRARAARTRTDPPPSRSSPSRSSPPRPAPRPTAHVPSRAETPTRDAPP